MSRRLATQHTPPHANTLPKPARSGTKGQLLHIMSGPIGLTNVPIAKVSSEILASTLYNSEYGPDNSMWHACKKKGQA